MNSPKGINKPRDRLNEKQLSDFFLSLHLRPSFRIFLNEDFSLWEMKKKGVSEAVQLRMGCTGAGREGLLLWCASHRLPKWTRQQKRRRLSLRSALLEVLVLFSCPPRPLPHCPCSPSAHHALREFLIWYLCFHLRAFIAQRDLPSSECEPRRLEAVTSRTHKPHVEGASRWGRDCRTWCFRDWGWMPSWSCGL